MRALCVLVVTACIGACSSAPPAATCTSLGQEILKAAAERATVPLRHLVGIGGVSDEEFARRRQEYAACAAPIRAAVKAQLFSTEHVRAVEQAARKQPDVTALDRQLQEENASSWQQIDAAVLRIATQCGQDPASFVRTYDFADGNIVETNPSFTTMMASHDARFNHLGAPPIWFHRDLERGFYPIRNCVSYRPAEPCITYRDPDPVIYESWFDLLPSLDDATNKTQLVCRFNFISGIPPYSDVHGKGTLDVTTRQVQFIPD